MYMYIVYKSTAHTYIRAFVRAAMDAQVSAESSDSGEVGYYSLTCFLLSIDFWTTASTPWPSSTLP